MKKGLSTKIANGIIKQYLNGDVRKMSPVELEIQEKLLEREDYPEECKYERTDYIRKKIVYISKTLMSNKPQSTEKIKLPNPQLNMDDYEENMDELIRFFKKHIELSFEKSDDGDSSNRKIVSNLYQKMFIDNEYTLADEILKDLTESPAEKLSNRENDIIIKTQEYYEGRWKEQYKRDIESVKKSSLCVKEKRKEATRRAIVAMERIIDDEILEKQPSVMNTRSIYYLVWDLWNRVILFSFQQLIMSLSQCSGDEYFENVILELQMLSKECPNDDRDKGSLSDGYYSYMKMVQYCAAKRSEIKNEYEKLHQDGYVFIRKEDLYTDENAKIGDFNNVKVDAELCRMFNSGTRPCKLETFKKRLDVCNKEFRAYASIANRDSQFNDLRSWRAFYRTLYINTHTLDRQKPVNIVRSINREPNERDGKITGKIHFISTMLSRRMREEYGIDDGIIINFMEVYFTFSLNLLYKSVPLKEEDRGMERIKNLNETMRAVCNIIINQCV